jgi:hypothetical protein
VAAKLLGGALARRRVEDRPYAATPDELLDQTRLADLPSSAQGENPPPAVPAYIAEMAFEPRQLGLPPDESCCSHR